MSSPTLDSFRDRFSSYSAPIIVFNKSHSGSRVLARLLEAAGVFMGSHLNESYDSLDIFQLVEYLVTALLPRLFGSLGPASSSGPGVGGASGECV